MLKQATYKDIVLRYFLENNVSRSYIMILVIHVFNDRYIQAGRKIDTPEIWEQGIKEGLIEYASKSLQTIFQELNDYELDDNVVNAQEIINFQNSVEDMPEFEGVSEAQRAAELTATTLRTQVENLRDEFIEELKTIKTDDGNIQPFSDEVQLELLFRELRLDDQRHFEALANELDIDLGVFNQEIEYKAFNKFTETQGEAKFHITINSKSMRDVRSVFIEYWPQKQLTTWIYNTEGQFINQTPNDIERGQLHNQFSTYLKRIFQRNNKSDQFGIIPTSTIILTWNNQDITIENARQLNDVFEEQDSYIEAIKRMGPWNQGGVLHLPFLSITWTAGNVGRWQEGRWPYLEIVNIINDAILEYTTGFETMFLEYFGDEPNE